jgi:hypothetical protein
VDCTAATPQLEIFVNFANLLLTRISGSVSLGKFDSASSLFRPRCFASLRTAGFFSPKFRKETERFSPSSPISKAAFYYEIVSFLPVFSAFFQAGGRV